MRGTGLVCLGAGAGLIRGDLRAVRGTDITARSGGVIVAVHGNRPRAVPVLARYHQLLLASAAFAGTGLVTGGHDPARRNLTTPLARALDGGTGLPRLDTSGLRATWLRRLRRPDRAGHVHARRRDHLQPAPRRPARRPRPRHRSRGGRAARGGAAMTSPPPLSQLEDIIEASGIAPRIEALLPAGARHRQLKASTLLLGMMLTLAGRPPPTSPGCMRH